ncbi:MAG: GNAT family N-acetyltransferase, partial [Thermoplasmata archaeon]|nr:GNAT family N-acetyltransferase [Thermoplasmata archaeon]
MPEAVSVRPAGSDDLGTVLAILSAASMWERSHGIEDPWPYPFPADRVTPSIERGEVFLATRAGDPVATINLSWHDPRFWGERPPDAGYVHRLAVRPDHAKEGIGRQL